MTAAHSLLPIPVCAAAPQRAQLRVHAPSQPLGQPLPVVQARWQLGADGWFEAHFQVAGPRRTAWNVAPHFSSSDYAANWGLWEHDVVELFLQPRPHPAATTAPYLELQCSPLAQPFALRIEEPGRRYASPGQLDYSLSCQRCGLLWEAVVRVAVPDYVPGTALYGNLTACLGPAEHRSYWGLTLNDADAVPDFHRPAQFLALV